MSAPGARTAPDGTCPHLAPHRLGWTVSAPGSRTAPSRPRPHPAPTLPGANCACTRRPHCPGLDRARTRRQHGPERTARAPSPPYPRSARRLLQPPGPRTAWPPLVWVAGAPFSPFLAPLLLGLSPPQSGGSVSKAPSASFASQHVLLVPRPGCARLSLQFSDAVFRSDPRAAELPPEAPCGRRSRCGAPA